MYNVPIVASATTRPPAATELPTDTEKGMRALKINRPILQMFGWKTLSIYFWEYLLFFHIK